MFIWINQKDPNLLVLDENVITSVRDDVYLMSVNWLVVGLLDTDR